MKGSKKLTKAQQEIINAMQDGTTIERIKNQGVYGSHYLGTRRVTPATMERIGYMLDYESRVEVMGYIKRQIWRLKEEYKVAVPDKYAIYKNTYDCERYFVEDFEKDDDGVISVYLQHVTDWELNIKRTLEELEVEFRATGMVFKHQKGGV